MQKGRFGQKNGAGFYRYEPGARNADSRSRVAAIIDSFRGQRGFKPRTVTEAEIIERCIYALVNAGARIVEEGIAQRSSDIDIVYLNGYGFPAFRGGPMFYADQTGLPEVVRALRRIARTRPAMPASGSRRRFWYGWPQQGGTFSDAGRSFIVSDAVIVSTARTGLARAGRARST